MKKNRHKEKASIDWKFLRSLKNRKIQEICLKKSRYDHSLNGAGYLEVEIEIDLISCIKNEKTVSIINKQSPETFEAILQNKKLHDQEWGANSIKCRDRINWEALSEFDHPLINTICDLNMKINSSGLSKKHGEILVQQLEKTIANATKVDKRSPFRLHHIA